VAQGCFYINSGIFKFNYSFVICLIWEMKPFNKIKIILAKIISIIIFIGKDSPRAYVRIEFVVLIFSKKSIPSINFMILKIRVITIKMEYK